MKATQLLHNLGQSLWLDNITRDLLNSGTLKRYIDELSVTGLTSNPTIFEKAISGSEDYDAQLRQLAAEGKSALDIYDELVLEVPEAELDAVRSNVRNLMQGVASLKVPLVVDIGVGHNWDEAH